MLQKGTYSRSLMYLRHWSTLEDLALAQHAGSNIWVKRHKIDGVSNASDRDRRFVILACVDVLRIIVSALLPSFLYVLFV